MHVDVIQLGVYAFGGATIALAVFSAPFILVGRGHRAVAVTFALWGWLWRVAAVYAGLALLAVGIPTSIDPLSSTTETVLSTACLAAAAPIWWLLHRWYRGRRARRDAIRATVEEAASTAEHAARVRRTGSLDVG